MGGRSSRFASGQRRSVVGASCPARPVAFVAAVVVMLAAVVGTASAAPPQIETFHEEGSFSIGPCPSGVTLFETLTEDTRIITFLDDAGIPVRVQVHFTIDGVITNPETRESVRDRGHFTRFYDLTEGTRAPIGLVFSTTIPGVGVVFHDVGRLVRGPDGSIVFEAGPHDVVNGGIVALFCSALGA